MKVVIQRVISASVIVDNHEISRINQGLLILLGVEKEDLITDLDYLVDKTSNLRIFRDENDNMNLSIMDVNGEILVVSQFTLYGDCKRGNRPSFINSAKSDDAKPIYNFFISKLKKFNINVESGKFGAMMDVKLINDGPVTIIIES